MSNKTLKNELHIIAQNQINNIEKAIALEALGRDNIQDFFSDLLTYRCASGMISSLVYYANTHEFYNTHYYQIEDIRTEYEDNTGLTITVNGDLKNFFAWFSFEETAYRMAQELGLEV